jgi:quinolinate synthase
MKATTLTDVYNTLRGRGGKEILLDEETIKKARKPIDEMIKRGG